MSSPNEARDARGDDDLAQLLSEIRKQARRLWSYARSRRAESWLFFAAGFLFAVVIG